MADDRLIALSLLAPRFFHILDKSDGFCCGELRLIRPDNLPHFADVLIENCKVGIWRSVFRSGDDGCDAIAVWVGEGQIDLAKSVEKWTDDEAEMAANYKSGIDNEEINTRYTWKSVGSCSQDGGSGSIIAKSYLTKAAGKEIMGAEEDEEIDMEAYLEMLMLTGMEFNTEIPENIGYTIGGLSCKSMVPLSRHFILVSGGNWVLTFDLTVDMTYIGEVWEARDENGEAVAVRMYLGEDSAEDRQMLGL